MKFNIRIQLLGFTVSIILLVGGSISLYSIYQGQKQQMDEFIQVSLKSSQNMSRAIMDELYSFKISNLRDKLQAAKINPDISFTYVLDSEGLILSDGTADNVLRDEKLQDAFSRNVFQSTQWIQHIEEDFLKVGGPVILIDETLGYLIVGYSLDRVLKNIYRTTEDSLIITALCLTIGCGFAFLLASYYSKPIRKIAEASRQIGEGKFDTEVRVKRNDELGILADAINQMTQNLKTEIEKRQRAHDGLKQTNEQLKQTQSQLIQSAKLASLGEMATGISHELNQPLAAISMKVENIMEEVLEDSPEEIIARLATVQGQVDRASKITNHLRTFGRSTHNATFKKIDINPIITNSFILINEQLRLRDIQVNLKLAKEKLPINGEMFQIEQVLNNLIMNAIDAMKEAPEKTLSIRSFRQKDRVMIEIEDTGEGISNNNLPKIFDPFFTTKEVGKGTGLGLSISHSIIENHQGNISVTSQIGKGTTFHLSLPQHQSV